MRKILFSFLSVSVFPKLSQQNPTHIHSLDFVRVSGYTIDHKVSQFRGEAWSSGVRHGPVDKAPGCCKVALGSIPRLSTPKMGSSEVDEQPTGGPTKIRG
jgi:hypothetical protein